MVLVLLVFAPSPFSCEYQPQDLGVEWDATRYVGCGYALVGQPPSVSVEYRPVLENFRVVVAGEPDVVVVCAKNLTEAPSGNVYDCNVGGVVPESVPGCVLSFEVVRELSV